MKTSPILFSGAMVRAILSGTKTQTRRIIKPQPVNPRPTCDEHIYADTIPPVTRYFACKFGLPGDTLWVRETFSAHGAFGEDGRISYRADFVDGKEPHGLHWKPSIFCTRAASRITLEITAVRVERLQSITEADAKAEGTPAIVTKGVMNQDGTISPYIMPARLCYQSLWNSINGPGSWDANPWVWAIEFRRVMA